MKKTKKVILKGNAEAIKKYNKQKFVDKGLEYLGSIIGIIILVLIINSFKSFKEYWADKEDLKKLLKQEDKYLTIEKIKKNVCKDFAKDAISKGDGNKECDAIAILRKKIDDNIFGFMLDNDYKKDSIQIAKKNNTKAKVSTAKKETKPSGCLEGDCVDGFSKIQYSNGYYIGEFKNKKEDGQGTYVWNSGDKYTGEWKNGLRTGQGTYIWSNGDKYSGDYINGDMHGQGTLVWANGDRYDGDFKLNIRDGQGTLTWVNGNKYSGQFRNNKFSGEGVYNYKNGDKYIGEYAFGKRNGKGTFIWSDDNTVHVGVYVDGKIGNGTQINPDGSKLSLSRIDGKIVAKRIQDTNLNQNLDLLLKQLKRKNNLQSSRMLLDISKNLMGSNQNKSSLNLNNSSVSGGFLSGSTSSGMYRTCKYSSSLGTKTKTVFASAPCPMAY